MVHFISNKIDPWAIPQVFEITAYKEGLKALKGMQQNWTAIYLDVYEPITTPCFHACCCNISKDIKSLFYHSFLKVQIHQVNNNLYSKSRDINPHSDYKIF